MALVATGLTKPRSIAFDSSGNLLVVQSGMEITSLAFQDSGDTCITIKNQKTVIRNPDVGLPSIHAFTDAFAYTSKLNHGLALSSDGKTIYASSSDAAYSWAYDPTKSTVSDSKTTLVTNMNTEDHTTRTLLMSQKVSGMLVISRGSTSNVDISTEVLSSGHSQIKAFNLKNVSNSGYDFDVDGLRLGWGLRNSVGVAEHPDTGGIYSVENSVDQIMRGEFIFNLNSGLY